MVQPCPSHGKDYEFKSHKPIECVKNQVKF